MKKLITTMLFLTSFSALAGENLRIVSSEHSYFYLNQEEAIQETIVQNKQICFGESRGKIVGLSKMAGGGVGFKVYSICKY